MQTSFPTNILFPLLEAYQGTSIEKNLRSLNESAWWTKEKLEELQDEKLRRLVRHAYDNVAYYRRTFDENRIRPEDIRTKEDLEVIPFLTREDVKKNLTDLVAKNVPSPQMYKCCSSGSTGEPLKYFLHKDAYSAGWAQAFRCWGWAGYEIGDPYVKISLLPRKTLMKKIQDRVMNCFYIYSSEIDEKTLGCYMERIKRFNPKIIRGYTAHMYVLAKYLENSGENDFEFPAVMTTGSTLYSHYREAIESQFGCRVYDCYGGESTTVAFECDKHEGYHLCSESVVAEFLKGERPASAGELAEVIFTNLDNYAMPLIRYKVNDIAVPSKATCSCGRGMPLIKSIEGRDTDIVVTPERKFLVVEYFAAMLRYVEGIEQFQVVQDDVNHLNIKIVGNERFDEKEGSKRIIDEIQKEAGKDVKIAVELVDSIPPSRSGKRRFVISKVPIESAWR